MGANIISGAPYESDELPVHSVSLSKFKISETEITVEQFCQMLNLKTNWFIKEAATDDGAGNDCFAVIRFNNKNAVPVLWLSSIAPVITNDFNFWKPVNAFQSNHPIVHVSWFGAALFCNFLSEQLSLSTIYNTNNWSCNFYSEGVCLPTEAQWEVAARAGNNFDSFPWGTFMNFNNCNVFKSGDAFEYFESQTSPVKTFSPNNFGLYDVIGNVREWCNDWFNYDYYQKSEAFNPKGPAPAPWLSGGTNKVTRGGGWAYSLNYPSISSRDYCNPLTGGKDIGFRVSITRLIPEPGIIRSIVLAAIMLSIQIKQINP